MEQFKSIPYASDSGNKLPCSPDTSPGTTPADWTNYHSTPDSNPTLPCKDATQEDITIYLAAGNPPTSRRPDVSTLPNDPCQTH